MADLMTTSVVMTRTRADALMIVLSSRSCTDLRFTFLLAFFLNVSVLGIKFSWKRKNTDHDVEWTL